MWVPSTFPADTIRASGRANVLFEGSPMPKTSPLEVQATGDIGCTPGVHGDTVSRRTAVTRKEAAAIIESIWQGPRELERDRAGHFSESEGKRRYSTQDVYFILRSHRMVPGAPEWMEMHRSFRVRLIGKCDGRRTLLVLDLRAEGPCTLVSIMEHTEKDLRKAKKGKRRVR